MRVLTSASVFLWLFKIDDDSHFLKRLASDIDGCFIRWDGLEHFALPSVDCEAQSNFHVRFHVCIFPHLFFGEGEKSQIVG
ncbi:hypothetical protein DPMN_083275 [Dreissena polymorpha]|uniref:Uncharacterized protein n=1 Tax=Dreissena polymorpha TaxID=45954 RepID=A0A9D3YBL5_DREPO|nr:hypothetical protein DPMN_083275 [Dreissena polymorpha]